MSPLFTQPQGGRERHAPAARKAETLFDLAKEIADLANDETERLSFEEYADLMECETKLLAYGNLLMVPDRDAFLKEAIEGAADLLAFMRERIGSTS